jgi:signal recognition particle subunit SRP54
MLDSLRSGLRGALQKLLGSAVIDEATIKEFVRDLQRSLIQADVNVKLVLNVTESVQKRAMEEKPPAGMTRKDQIVKILYEELQKVLGGSQTFQLGKDRVNIAVMLGIQGSGKTTTVAKRRKAF